MVLLRCKSDDVTSLFKTLQGLPISLKVKTKVFMMTSNALHVLVIIASMTSSFHCPPHSLCSCHIPTPGTSCCCLRALARASALPGVLSLYTPAWLSAHLLNIFTECHLFSEFPRPLFSNCKHFFPGPQPFSFFSPYLTFPTAAAARKDPGYSIVYL